MDFNVVQGQQGWGGWARNRKVVFMRVYCIAGWLQIPYKNTLKKGGLPKPFFQDCRSAERPSPAATQARITFEYVYFAWRHCSTFGHRFDLSLYWFIIVVIIIQIESIIIANKQRPLSLTTNDDRGLIITLQHILASH